jgi:hypothetical protein
MRMWMVDPRAMCRHHLLGEHLELHMLAGALRRGKSVDGFLAKGLLEPGSARTRHGALASEMHRRGYRHASPLPAVRLKARHQGRFVDRAAALAELRRRCPECASLKEAAK